MNTLNISERKDSPEVLFNIETKEFCIKGRSFPEDSQSFYNPIIDWFDEINSPMEINLKIDLIYISSASTIALRRLFKKLEELKENGFQISISWYFEQGDDDIKISGERYRDSSTLSFDIIEY